MDCQALILSRDNCLLAYGPQSIASESLTPIAASFVMFWKENSEKHKKRKKGGASGIFLSKQPARPAGRQEPPPTLLKMVSEAFVMLP